MDNPEWSGLHTWTGGSLSESSSDKKVGAMPASRSVLSALASVLLVAASAGSVATAAEPLPALSIDLNQTTVSGLSSGAFMAVQFHVAFSSVVRGAGVVAGGPYYCAEGQLLTNALHRCMQTRLGPPDPERLLGLARGFAKDGLIDPVENLADDRAYLFTGTNDQTVTGPVVNAARQFYLAAGVQPSQLTYRSDLPTGHGMVTENSGVACSQSKAPYINDCDFDLAGAILGHLYPNLQPPSANNRRTGTVLAFDQTEFFTPRSGMDLTGFTGVPAAPGSAASRLNWPSLPSLPGIARGLHDTGFAYVPAACAARSERCRVHIVFHGCKQTVADIQERYVRDTGYNRWADSNGIVVLYPQAKSEKLANPNGCWDWWGYSGGAYATKAGQQMVAVRAMLDRLAGK